MAVIGYYLVVRKIVISYFACELCTLSIHFLVDGRQKCKHSLNNNKKSKSKQNNKKKKKKKQQKLKLYNIQILSPRNFSTRPKKKPKKNNNKK